MSAKLQSQAQLPASITRVVNEPTAAALAYGLDKAGQELKILVFSFGGGTNDTTVMEFGGGVFKVLATRGGTKTGGTDLTKMVMDYVICDSSTKPEPTFVEI